MAQTQQDRFGKIVPLKERIQILLQESGRNPGLLLYLLLALPTRSIVTQNYDQLIERACECRNITDKRNNNNSSPPTTQRQKHDDEQLSVIPYNPRRGVSRWLLKMHGCISHPEDIVLTQSDYDTFEASRLSTLSALVQANLMTSHFLFVGFSLTDPNYLRILEKVRSAMSPGLQQT